MVACPRLSSEEFADSEEFGDKEEFGDRLRLFTCCHTVGQTYDHDNGQPPGFSLAKTIAAEKSSSLSPTFPHLVQPFTRHQQALHDMLSSCVVVDDGYGLNSQLTSITTMPLRQVTKP